MPIVFDYSDMKRILFEAVVIVCFAVLLGLTFNYRLIMNVFEGSLAAAPVPAGTWQAELYPVPVSLAEVRQLLPRATLVDARIPELYAEAHLPGAISLPLTEIDARLETFARKHPVDRPLILYCGGYGCTDSFDLAIVLIKNGYRDVMVYEGGFPEWRDAGLPVEEGAP